MFKIICFYNIKYPNVTFLDIFIFKNLKIKISKNYNKHILPKKSYKWFENITGINILQLLKFYNINNNNIKSFKNIINLNHNIDLQSKYPIMYNLINFFYCDTLEELYNNYKY